MGAQRRLVGDEALGLEVNPKHIVDIVNGSNNVALGLVLQGAST